jgi:exopolysaccharide biosynthesis polyprenyl glycosylphosphotransferase
MAQAANIFDAASLRRPQLAIAAAPGTAFGTPASARLIPGAGNLISAATKKSNQSGMQRGEAASVSRALPGFAARLAVRVLPEFFRQFHPAWLGTALGDVALLCLVFLLESTVFKSMLSSIHASVLALTSFGFFLTAFLLLAIPEGLYSDLGKAAAAECGIATKAILWAGLLTSLALRCSSSRPALLPLMLLSAIGACALCMARMMVKAVPGAAATGRHRNVLIVGSSPVVQKTADAIGRDFRCPCSVKGFLADHHIRGINGPVRLRNIAREECVDEIIIATHDREVAEAAIREARRNQIDVRVVAELFGAGPEALELENLDGVPLVRIHHHPLPEWALAAKRIADVVLAAAGLLALSPLLLLVAAVVKLDSPGPVFYRGVRVGRKRQKFLCCKFRTMIPEADAAKEKLRTRNEREGAFFKIADDPRVTRTGRFLRRYSLDELPQLWNVLRGEMSLVGPRPHPPDDVERYRVEHLQRLDFVPGITGLWQVTARRDRSFERSVTLDVEYIQRWSLALDLQILWKTIPSVFQGSGA